MKHFFRWIGALFFGIGLIFIIVAAFLLYRDVNFANTAEKTQGTVIRFVQHISHEDRRTSPSVTYTAVIEFTDSSGRRQELSERISSNPPRFSSRESVPILYDPTRPSHAVVDDFWGRKGIAVIFSAVAVPLTILGAAFLVIDIRRGQKTARLHRHGRPIEATFLHVFRDERMSRNGEHPYRIVAQARDLATGRLRRFESEPVWVDPSERLEGREVRVLVDPIDARNYHVDLSTIIETGDQDGPS